MPLVAYIAAPFAPREGLSVQQNVANARALAKIAFSRRLPPLLVHHDVEQEVYGRDHVPEDRVLGLAATRAIAALVGKAGGELWMLLLPSGRMSTGCHGEWVAFGQAALAARATGTSRFFRLESRKPVEHWDSTPTCPAEAPRRGANAGRRRREDTGVTAWRDSNPSHNMTRTDS